MESDRCRRQAHGRTRRTFLGQAASGLLALWAGVRLTQPVSAQDATPETCPATTPEENRALARRYHEDAMSGHDLSVLDELLAPTSAHNAATFPDNPGTKAIFAALLQSFPDLQVTVELTIAEGDQVATRWQATGTDTGGFRGNSPTGRTATWTGITVFTFKCGRIVQIADQSDGLSRMRQMGLLPELGAPTTATPEVVSPATRAACPVASTDENRAVAKRWFADAVNPRALDLLDELVAPDAVLHAAGFPDSTGPEGIKDLFRTLFSGFSDLHFTVEPGPAEGDLVLEGWTATGRHDGEFQGVAPTSRQMSWSGINIYRVACGQIAEVWTEADTLGRLKQLGVLPDLGSAAAATPTS